MSWKREFEEAAATLTLRMSGWEDLLPVRASDDIEVKVKWSDGYDPTFTNGPNSASIEITLVREGKQTYGAYRDEEFERFWIALMRDARPRSVASCAEDVTSHEDLDSR